MFFSTTNFRLYNDGIGYGPRWSARLSNIPRNLSLLTTGILYLAAMPVTATSEFLSKNFSARDEETGRENLYNMELTRDIYAQADERYQFLANAINDLHAHLNLNETTKSLASHCQIAEWGNNSGGRFIAHLFRVCDQVPMPEIEAKIIQFINEAESEWTTREKINLGVGIGVTLTVVSVLVYCIVSKCREKQREEQQALLPEISPVRENFFSHPFQSIYPQIQNESMTNEPPASYETFRK